MSTLRRLPLRVVFYHESDRWIAHCLEFDLIGDGDSIAQALASLSRAIQIQIEYSAEHNSPENLFSPAEGKYFRMFAEGQAPCAEGELALHVEPASRSFIELETAEFREYQGSDLATT